MFANLILEGSKRVELRRAIPSQPISTIVIYSSSPVQAIVALADVSEIVEGSPSKLWAISRDYGGGLTRAALLAYFDSKKLGYALMLENVRVFANPVTPTKIFKKFSAPQSFRYLSPRDLQRIEKILELEQHK